MYWVVAALLLWTIEAAVMSERPAWLAPFARLRLASLRRFALPPTVRPADDATYRDQATRPDGTFPRVSAFRVEGLRVTPVEGGASFAVIGDGWRVSHLERIDLRREGDEVSMTVHFAPLPLSLLVTSIALLVWLVRRSIEAPQAETMWVFALGALVAPFSFFFKARAAAEEAAPRALAALEGALLRAGGKGTPSRLFDGKPELDRTPWRGRLLALVPLLAAAFLLGQGARRDNTKRILMTTQGLSEREAERLGPILAEASRELWAFPPARAAFRQKAPSAADIAEATARGAFQLNDDELLEQQALRERLAAASPEICALFGAGGGDSHSLLAFLARQDDDTLRAWFRLNMRSAKLAFANPGATPEDAAGDLTKSVQAMIAQFPEAERGAFLARLQPTEETNTAWCDRFLARSEGLRRLPPPERARYLRALAALPAR